MKRILKFLKITLLGGIFFLVPLIVILILAQRGIQLIQKIIAPIVNVLPEESVFGLGLRNLASVIIVILFCFLVGFFAKTRFAKRIVSGLEDNVLINVPGYGFMKNMYEGMMGVPAEKEMPVVLVKVDDAWQIAFQVEVINENLFTVFVPDAPSPWSGGVYFIEKDKMRPIDISQKQALKCIKKLGFGSAELLKDKV